MLLLAYANRFLVLFGASLVLLSVSLVYSLYEVVLSTNAINLELEDFEAKHRDVTL